MFFNINSIFIVSVVLILITLFLYIKNRNNIKYLYILMFSSIMIPLFDFPHLAYFFFVFNLLWINKIPFKDSEIVKNALLFTISFSIVFFLANFNIKDIDYPNHYHNFNFRLMFNSNGENIIRDKVISYINNNKNKNIVIIASDSYFYKITTDSKIDYFNLNNYGNHGYNGTKKMKRKIDKLEKGTIIIVNTVESKLSKNSLQFNKEIAKYAMKKGTFIKKLDCFSVYEIR